VIPKGIPFGNDPRSPAFRPNRSADVWFRFAGDLTEFDIAAARAVLSPIERKRCERFVFDCDRQTFAAGHALLRSTLTFHERLRSPQSWVFQTGSHGKPCLAPGQSELAFNMTHTAGLVACALAKVESIGVDVESVERTANADEIAASYFSQREVLALEECAGLERQTRFIELWTLKEAYLKATGAGLSAPLNKFGFELCGASGLQFNPPDNTTIADWHFALFAPSPHYRLAVAVRSVQLIEFRVRGWPPGSTSAQLVPLRASRPIGSSADEPLGAATVPV
jgi:4'-phosphopantetheinyl transferase